MLHIISANDENAGPWMNCVSVLDDEDVVVFLADGAFALSDRKFEQTLDSGETRNVQLFALKDDLKARSITPNNYVKPITIQKLAQLVAKENKSMSWF